MIVCIPIEDDRGMHSPVCAHFGRAPAFLLVDTSEGTCRSVTNGHDQRSHGRCTPIDLLAGERVEALIVGGIGQGALNRFANANIHVYRAHGRTVDEAVAALQTGALEAVDPEGACSQHGHHHAHHGGND